MTDWIYNDAPARLIDAKDLELLHPGDPFWLEMRDRHPMGEWVLYRTAWSGKYSDDEIHDLYYFGNRELKIVGPLDNHDYNRTWRLWNGAPEGGETMGVGWNGGVTD